MTGLHMPRRKRGLAVVGALAAAALSFSQVTAAGGGPLVNLGGPTQLHPKVYLVFWGPQWSVGWTDVHVNTANNTLVPAVTTYTSGQEMAYITDFFKFATSHYTSQLQYTGVGGTVPAYANSWVDTSSTPPPTPLMDDCFLVCLIGTPSPYDDAISAEAVRAEAHFLGAGNDPNANFMIMLPKATQTIGVLPACAYHSETTDAAGNKVAFTNMPFVPDKSVNITDGILIAPEGCPTNFVNPNDNAYGNGFLDPYSIVAGHEEAEVMTDPFPGTAPAWRDSTGQETGDICAWISPGSNGGAHNTPGTNGHVYAVQTYYSNKAHGCV